MKTVIVGLLVSLFAAPPALRLEVYPRLGTAPSDMRVRVWVEREDSNRWLEVRAVSETFGRSTGFSLDGEAAPSVFEWFWKSMPCGAYEVRAQVTRIDGQTRNARSSARFVGPACDVTGGLSDEL